MSNLSLSGQVRLQVVNHDGSIAHETPWQGNLLLDQGMNKMAEMPIADIFQVGILGTDGTETNETPVGNTYTQLAFEVTRASGTRAFTANDEGKRIVFSGGKEATILTFNDGVPNKVDVSVSQTVSPAETIKLYHVHQAKLAGELLVDFSEGAGATLSKAAASSTVTSSGPLFVSGYTDGYAIYFPSQAKAFKIATFVNANTVTITIESGDDFTTSAEALCAVYFVSDLDDPELPTISRSRTYSTAVGDNGSTMTGAVVGPPAAPDYIKEMKRTIIFPPVNADYTITEVGFSDSILPAYNANIRVKLLSAVNVDGPVGATPGQQLRLQYIMKVELPKVVSAVINCPITDPTSSLSSNKEGQYATEGIFLSGVSTDGETESEAPILDPYFAPLAAIGPNTDPLDPLNYPVRDAGFTVETEMEPYIESSFKTVFVAIWGVNDAIATNHRTIMLYHEASDTPAWTFRFIQGRNQHKDGLHSLTIRFQKTWSRILSP